MTMKTFNCVEMKHQAQAKLMQEYQARRMEFDSYADFINITADLDSKITVFRKNLSKEASYKIANRYLPEEKTPQ